MAVARLLGYHWPQQVKDDLDSLADEDGIVCLPSAAGEAPLVERLRGLLVQAYGDAWISERTEPELLAAAGAPGKSLDEWLRDDFFAQHCRMFHNRPFVWHIWDGRKDGFSALVNYHKLDAARLDKLIFTYLGDWIRFQTARRDQGEPGADGRLVAALELEKKLKADQGRRAAVRYLCALEAAQQTTPGLEPGSERWRAAEYPAVCHCGRAAQQVHDQLEQRPRQEPGWVRTAE